MPNIGIDYLHRNEYANLLLLALQRRHKNTAVSDEVTADFGVYCNAQPRNKIQTIPESTVFQFQFPVSAPISGAITTKLKCTKTHLLKTKHKSNEMEFSVNFR